MKYVSEIADKKQEVLIVDAQNTTIGNLLKSELKKFDADVFVSPKLPNTYHLFHLIFIINAEDLSEISRLKSSQKIILLFVGKKREAKTTLEKIKKRSLGNIKIIYLGDDQVGSRDLERILWFSLSKSSEVFLSLETTLQTSSRVKKDSFLNKDWKKIFTRKRILLFSLFFILIYHIFSIPFMGLSSYLFLKSVTSFGKGDIPQANRYLSVGRAFHNVSKNLYRSVRPTYLLFSLALVPDTAVDINDTTDSLLKKTIISYENAKQVISLILQKFKSEEERQLLLVRISKMRTDLDEIESDLLVLEQKLPDQLAQVKKVKQDIREGIDLMRKTRRLLPHLEYLLAKDTQQQYLLLFANNMELRPGGGFIGSFGILTMKDLTLEGIEVFDVYDADGQLDFHVDPPDPIRRYLNQPNWFLRDSAFSSDFFDNYTQAKFFLREEMGFENFSGGILLTMTSIQNILEAFDTITLADFNETVTKDNFYIKAQLYAEKNFFPGSIQKKNFLGSLTKHLLINLDRAPVSELLQMLKKSLDEKQIVVILEDPEIQSVFDSLYWAGKTITPKCATSAPCIGDYVFPFDANLGVNKANFFVNRTISQKIVVEEDGTIQNQFIVKLKNDSTEGVFPGGTYKNYFQILLPKDAELISLTKNNTTVREYDEIETQFKVIGFYLEVPTQSSSEIKVEYRLNQKLPQGKSNYQLIFQKQIGSKNSDISLELILPSNVSAVNQNFSPVVKDNRIFYNTNLSTDKIFLIELVRKSL